MPIWNPPATFVPGQVVAASDLNAQLRDNTLYLLAGRPAALISRNGGSDYTTPSTSFVDVDAANLILTLTLNSSRAFVLATFFGGGTSTPGGAMFDWIVDSTTRAGGALGLISSGRFGSQSHSFTVAALFSGLAPGTHTFKLQYATATGTGNAIINNLNSPITLLGLEV